VLALLAAKALSGLAHQAGVASAATVVVAVAPVEAGSSIALSGLALKVAAVDTIPPDALRGTEDAAGRTARLALRPGDILTARSIAGGALPRGMRSFALVIDEAVEAAGVSAGMRVDVIATFSSDVAGKAQSRTLLQGLAVLEAYPAREGASGIVLLAVSPAQAERLAFARSFGRLVLVGAPEADHSSPPPGVGASEILGSPSG